MYIVQESNLITKLVPKQSFFAVAVELDSEVVKKIETIQADATEVSEYLTQIAAALSTRADINLSLIGLPSCLDVSAAPEVVKESKPEKKATEVTSKRKWLIGSRKTEQKESDTKPPKDE